MPEKIGNGGHSLENYDENTGKYVADGTPNKSYNNPEEQTAMKMFGLSSDESIEDVDDWMFEDEPENDPFDLVREDKDSFVVDKDRLEAIKSELEYDGFETEEGSPTFDDIYNDFVKEKNKQPNGAYEILDFVKEKVGEDLSKGDNMRYKVKMKIRKSALPKSTATAVQEEY